MLQSTVRYYSYITHNKIPIVLLDAVLLTCILVTVKSSMASSEDEDLFSPIEALNCIGIAMSTQHTA
jgi:hypothetical protein